MQAAISYGGLNVFSNGADPVVADQLLEAVLATLAGCGSSGDNVTFDVPGSVGGPSVSQPLLAGRIPRISTCSTSFFMETV